MEELKFHTEAEAADAIRRWFEAALRAVEPATAVRAHLGRDGRALLVGDARIDATGRLFLIAVGKAAEAMTAGAIALAGDLVSAGVILTKEGHLQRRWSIPFAAFEAGHPIPDRLGERATRRILELLDQAREGDVVLTLISGGGSALLEAPREGIRLDEIAATTDLLLKAGAPIQDLNAVRVALSRVKGGGLRASASRARFVTLVLSDVLGNDPSVIASGPTSPGQFTAHDALAMLEKYGVAESAPKAVVEALRREEAPLPNHLFEDDLTVIIGDNQEAVRAFAEAAGREGVASCLIWQGAEGEAREAAKAWVTEALGQSADCSLLLGGGELTVTVTGDGCGGRNTEFALAAALELERHRAANWVVAGLATDGQDGSTGMAGAIASVGTLARAREAGVDPELALKRNDSLAVFLAAGGAVETGPTGTNVNDLYVALRLDPRD